MHKACHFAVTPISRSEGRSAVAAVAYRPGARLWDEQGDCWRDYRRKRDIMYAEHVGWAGEAGDLWNCAETTERRGNARVVREMTVSLPCELPLDDQIALARGYCLWSRDSYGVVSTYAIHHPYAHGLDREVMEDVLGQNRPAEHRGDPRNHHFHVLMTTWRWDPATGTLAGKVRDFDDRDRGPETVRRCREEWERRVNARLGRRGIAERVDLRSHAARATAGEGPEGLVPQPKVGPAAAARARCEQRRTGTLAAHLCPLTMPDTLILTRPEIAALMEPRAMLDELRAAFVAAAVERPAPGLRVPVALPPPAPADASAMVLLPGAVAGIPAYTVKGHAKVPGATLAIQGVIVLHDLATGHPLAILGSTLLTALRTGLAGALGADALARPDSSRVAIVGAGAQGVFQLEALTLVRPIEHAWTFGNEPGRAAVFAAREGARLGLRIEAAASLAEAVRDADVVVAATWAREPFLFASTVRRGAHVTTLGPDQPGKCEVDAGLLREALVVVDDRDLALSMGATGGAGLGADAINTTLDEVLAGRHPGRTCPEQVTVLGAVGLPWQDLVAARHAYRRAKAAGVGTRVALLGA